MSLKTIETLVASNEGINTTLNAAQKARYRALINLAAEEIWESTDLPGCEKEVVLRVTADKEMALPSFVGELRGIRSLEDETRWNVTNMRPRYSGNPWPDKWTGWRYKGMSAIQTEITNAAPLTVAIPVADATVTLTITGSTANSNNIAETLTLSVVSQVTTNSFLQIHSITKNGYNDTDITVSDADGNVLAVVYNNYLKSQYVIVDVSAYPTYGTCVDGLRLMECLYKMPLPTLINDNDEFPVYGYDKIIADKTIQIIQEKKEPNALLMDAKIARNLANKVAGKEQAIEKKLQFGRSVHDLRRLHGGSYTYPTGMTPYDC